MFRLMAVRIDTSCLWSIHEEMCFVTAEAMVNERSEILQNHLDLDVFGLNFDADSDAGKRCFYEYQVMSWCLQHFVSHASYSVFLLINIRSWLCTKNSVAIYCSKQMNNILVFLYVLLRKFQIFQTKALVC